MRLLLLADQRYTGATILWLLQEYILEQLDAAYREVGFQEAETDTDANHQRLIFRSTLLGYACRLGQESCVNNATAVFKTFRNGGDKYVSSRSQMTCFVNGLVNSVTPVPESVAPVQRSLEPT